MLNTTPENRTIKRLLVSRKKTIKKIDKILKILDCIPKKSYPESYLKIKKAILEDVNIYIK